MRISKFLLNVFCLSLVCAGVSAQESQYSTGGTEIKAPNDIETGYYIINAVQGPGHTNQGLLCWNPNSSKKYYFGIDTQKTFIDLTNKSLDLTNQSVRKYIFYIEVTNNGNKTFKIKSLQGEQYLSNSNASDAEKDLKYVQSTTSGDDVAYFEFTYKPNEPITITVEDKKDKEVSHKVSHFIAKLANKTTNPGIPVFLHAKSVTDFPLSFYKGYNQKGGTCCKLAFFKLSKVDESQSVNITYKYRLNGIIVKEEIIGALVDQEYPKPMLPAFCTAEKPEGTVSADDTEKIIDVEWKGPFTFTFTYPKDPKDPKDLLKNANWYYLHFTSYNIVITNKGEGKIIPVKENSWSTATSTRTLSLKELWAFVGNPFDGFKIYNAYKSNNGGYGRLVTPIDWSNEGKNAKPYVSYAETLTEDKYDVWTISDPRSYPQSEVTDENSFFIGYKVNENEVYHLNASTDHLAFWTVKEGKNSAFTVQDLSSSFNEKIVFKPGGDNYYYSTFYIDYPVKVESDYIEVSTGTLDETNAILRMTKSNDNIIPANTGVILRMPEDYANKKHSYALTNATPKLQKASLNGTIKEILLTAENRYNYLFFGKSGGILGFYRANSAITSIAPYKAFLDWSPENRVRAFKLVFDETTSIDASTIFGDEENGLSPQAPIYDLSGRRVQHTTRGIYIQHGKKVFVK